LEYIKPYPSDFELRKMYYELNRWKTYKNNIVDNIKLDKAMKTSTFSSLLRSQITVPKVLGLDYLSLNEQTDIYNPNFKTRDRCHLL